MKNGASKQLWKYWVQYTNLCLIEGILYRKHQTETNFETVYQMLVPRERVSNVLELLHDCPSAGQFRIKKTYQRACEKFYWPFIEICNVFLKGKALSRNVGIRSQNGNQFNHIGKYRLISWVHLPSLRHTYKYILLIGDQFN